MSENREVFLSSDKYFVMFTSFFLLSCLCHFFLFLYFSCFLFSCKGPGLFAPLCLSTTLGSKDQKMITITALPLITVWRFSDTILCRCGHTRIIYKKTARFL